MCELRRSRNIHFMIDSEIQAKIRSKQSQDPLRMRLACKIFRSALTTGNGERGPTRSQGALIVRYERPCLRWWSSRGEW